MTRRISLTETAHNIIRAQLHEGMLAVDATVGNGHDTLFLAGCVGRTGHVYGFDVQLEAIEATRRRLQQHEMQAAATLFLASHAQMALEIPQRFHGRIQAIMFNLGYLPGGQKAVITHSDSTLQALEAARQLLAERAVMTVTAYPGHAGGDEETEQVDRWFRQLDSERYECEVIFSQHQQAIAPRLFVLRKVR